MAREKYLLRDDETGYYWKSTLKQSTIDAIVNPISANITKEVDELQTSLEAKLDAINSNITAVKTSVDTVKGSVDSVGAKVDTANTKLDTIITNTTPETPTTDPEKPAEPTT